MEENKNKEAVSLDQEELEKVAGGDGGSEFALTTLAEVEGSPIFNKLKKWLRKTKDAGHSKTADLTLLNLQRYVISLHYFIMPLAGIGFIKKYWDLV